MNRDSKLKTKKSIRSSESRHAKRIKDQMEVIVVRSGPLCCYTEEENGVACMHDDELMMMSMKVIRITSMKECMSSMSKSKESFSFCGNFDLDFLLFPSSLAETGDTGFVLRGRYPHILQSPLLTGAP